MNRRREKLERDQRVTAAEQMAARAHAQARTLVEANRTMAVATDDIRSDNAALRAALIRKALVTKTEIDAEMQKVAVVVRP